MNPAAPTPADATAEPRLFSPGAIAAHTILFTPLVGGLMAARNWRRLGETKRARQTALLAVGAITAMVLLAVFWPERWGEGAIQGGLGGVTIVLAMQLRKEQKPAFEAVRARGGKTAPFWPATLGGLVLIGLVLAASVASVLLAPGSADFQAGSAALQRNDAAAAEAAFRKVLALDPTDDVARYNLAVALARQGDPGWADELAKIRQDSPMSPQARALEKKLAGTLPDP